MTGEVPWRIVQLTVPEAAVCVDGVCTVPEVFEPEVSEPGATVAEAADRAENDPAY